MKTSWTNITRYDLTSHSDIDKAVEDGCFAIEGYMTFSGSEDAEAIRVQAQDDGYIGAVNDDDSCMFYLVKADGTFYAYFMQEEFTTADETEMRVWLDKISDEETDLRD